MDTTDLLDILGNENRRNILTLLSYRPCYMTEISEELKVSPKAIIDHLKMLEEAGLIESFYDEQRRRYYEIANNVRIEVSISPLSFSIDVSKVETGSEGQRLLRDMYPALTDNTVETLRQMQEELERLYSSSEEMSKAQRSMQGMISEVTGMCIQLINEAAADQIEAEILYILVRRPVTREEIARKLNIPEGLAGEELESMRVKGLVRFGAGLWRI